MRMRRRVVAFLLLISCGIDAFRGPSPRHNSRRSSSSSSVQAKPPPTSSVDLDAIEAFEASLLERERQKQEEQPISDQTDSSGRIPETNLCSITIPPEWDGQRIDAALAALLLPTSESAPSRSWCGKLLSNGQVHVIRSDDSERLLQRKSEKVETGMRLRVYLPAPEPATEIQRQELPLEIVYEDEHMIVLNKEADVVVHPAPGNWDGTIVNALAHYFYQKQQQQQQQQHESKEQLGTEYDTFLGALPRVVGDGEDASEDDVEDDIATSTSSASSSLRPGIVHRLDKGTTGLLVVAKTQTALSALTTAFADRRVHKTYLAVTVGNPGQRVVIDKPIGRHPVHRQRMRVVPAHAANNKRQKRGASTTPAKTGSPGKRALSFVDTLATNGKLSLVRVKIETGRTHQIRVHLQDKRTPVYGDDLYGFPDWNKRLDKALPGGARPLLHAYKLQLHHPVTGERLAFTAPIPDDMAQILKTISPNAEEDFPEIVGPTFSHGDTPW